MRAPVRAAAAALLLTSLAIPASAQQPGVVKDLLQDIASVEQKLVGLAKAMPEASYAWKPGQGVRTTGEVFQHVAADNYFMPTVWKLAAPAATGIKEGDYNTVQAYETRKVTRDEAIADLERSFAHLKQAMEKATPEWLQQTQTVFGMSMTGQGFLILTATHLHEHLGQMIAYARSNGIKPPWSN